MTGPEHYTEAERLIAVGERVVDEIREAKGDEARRDALGKQAMGIWAQAQGHATLALVSAQVEIADIARRPLPADEWDGGDPAYPGNAWGRALFGEVPK